jgi:hypothetical protein
VAVTNIVVDDIRASIKAPDSPVVIGESIELDNGGIIWLYD